MSKHNLLKKVSLGVAALALIAPMALSSANINVNARHRYRGYYRVVRRHRRHRRRPTRRRARRTHRIRHFRRYHHNPRVVRVRPFKGTATSYCETVNTLSHRHRHFSHLLGQSFKVVANVYGRHNIIACKIIYHHHVLYANPNAINNGINSYGI